MPKRSGNNGSGGTDTGQDLAPVMQVIANKEYEIGGAGGYDELTGSQEGRKQIVEQIRLAE